MITGSEGAARDEAQPKPSMPSVSLPKGGGAIRGMGEKFAANPVNGTGNTSIPIATSPGRAGFGPALSLAYDSGAGNGPFGFGWSLSLPAITRKTDQGLPRYQDGSESDVYLLSGVEDLVPELERDAAGEWVLRDGAPIIHDRTRTVGHQTYQVRRYRPRIEGLFARIERWTHSGTKEIHWRSISRDNVTTVYGFDNNSRIYDPADPDPAHPTRIYSWLICQSYDDKGNVLVYGYQAEDSRRIFEDVAGQPSTKAHEVNRSDTSRSAQRYLKRVRYGNRTPYFPILSAQAPWPAPPDANAPNASSAWHFEVVFDYGDHDPAAPGPTATLPWPARVDPFSSYRSGFEVRTYRLCRRVLMFHHFPAETGVGADCLVRSTDLRYSEELDPTRTRSPVYTFLRAVTQTGYQRRPAGAGYDQRSLPPVEFEYTTPHIQDRVEELDPESLENLPIGLDGSRFRFVDLHGEGVPGILTEEAGAWFYKRNLSPIPWREANGQERVAAHFGPMETVALRPNLPLAVGADFMDLAGDGLPDLVVWGGATPGLYEHDDAEGWLPFRPFPGLPNRDLFDPNLRFVDLDGDGRADLLITEDEAFVWHPSLGEGGFGPAQRVVHALDEQRGPRLVFADRTQSIHLADLSGDGLTDLVRVRNGEVSYWPNLGYGHFGAKVTMDHAPLFDHPEQFDHQRLRLADLDGSGTTDLIYLHRDGPRLYFNQSGNSWSEAHELQAFPKVDDLATIVPVDLLGNGTACLAWSSALPGDGRRPLRYVDLMGNQKPHLLVRISNNLGAETQIRYAPSTKFYLADKRDGRPWVTRLPMPVQVVEQVETWDHLSRNRFVTRYAYHHGYFDGEEREFRGFGLVEQWDSETLASLAQGALPANNVAAISHVPPVHTKTWFHTGVYLGRDHVSDYFAGLGPGGAPGEYFREPGLSASEVRGLLLSDTVLPGSLTPDEEREACRALKGMMLRQEVYADDASDPVATAEQQERARTPYRVTEQNFALRLVQPQANNRHPVFHSYTGEVLSVHYERDPSDPRIQHALTLEVDDHGNVLKQVSVAYGRRAQVRAIDLLGNVQVVPNPGLLALPLPEDRRRQTTALLVGTEAHFTDAVDGPDTHLLPLACEAITFELTDHPASGPALGPGNGAPRRYQAEDFVEPDPTRARRLRFKPGDEVSYETPATGNPCRRPIEWLRTLYRREDLSGPLPLGQLQAPALKAEDYRLAFTPGLLRDVFQRPGPGPSAEALLPDPAAVLAGAGASRGGYLSSQVLKADGRFPLSDPDDHWWLPSGQTYFSVGPGDSAAVERTQARQHFYQPRRHRDPFGQDNVVALDGYDLLLTEARDALGNRITVLVNDYRVLKPSLVSDPNRNQSAVAFDLLGLVVGTALMGKPAPAPVEGDNLTGLVPELTLAELDAFFGAADPHAVAPGLLGNATSRVVYDLDRFRRSKAAHPNDPTQWAPPGAVTMARETHAAAPLPAQGLKIQLSFSYSDGFGREIQKKIQAEPGPVVDGGPDVDPRWVASGWTVFNNQGKPVRQYEPFFSATHQFEFGVQVGVSPVLFYDPVGRVIATLHPNHTYEKVAFGPWQQSTYDVNDTSAPRNDQTGDPRTDPDIGGYVQGYFRAQPPSWQTWSAQRGPGAPAEEQAAARRAAAHADTPSTAHFDVLGRPFLTVNRNRVSCPGHALDGTEEEVRTRVELDIEGHTLAVRDERRLPVDHLPTGGTEQRTVMRYVHNLLGSRIYQLSMDAGARWLLNDAAGKLIRAWDSRGHNFTTRYDALRRPIEQTVRGTTSSGDAASDPRTLNRDFVIERVEYGEPSANATQAQHDRAIQLNLRTRVFRHSDSAGVLTHARLDAAGNPVEAYDFKGNLLHNTRRLLRDHQGLPDWLQGPALFDEAFVASTRYDAMNRPIQSVAPHSDRATAKRHIFQTTYNEANLLERLDVWLERATEPNTLLDPNTEPPSPVGVSDIDYDAKGQRQRIEYKNGVATDYHYDPLTFRLTEMETRRNPGQALQRLRYTYDPAGNITHLQDDAQDTLYFHSKRVEPSNDYTYDALYRLIEATGREHLGQAGGPLPHNHDDAGRVGQASADAAGQFSPSDGNAMGTYLERYVYDAVGNFLQMQHRGSDPAHPGWTRRYTYSEANNRLSHTQVGNGAPGAIEPYRHDAHGNMVRMPHLGGASTGPNLHFDHRDRLRRSDLGGGGTAYYVYDASGQRVRKVWEKSPGLIEERIYLGGFELFRRHGGAIGTGAVELERETLHITDDRRRIGMVEIRTADVSGTDRSPRRLVRYVHGNHLGSSNLEVDEQAQIISYEEYAPFGSSTHQAVRSRTETPKRYRFSGKERDEETGLSYHGARYYAPWIGNWVAADPAGLVDGTNLYAYARRAPTMYADPTGLATEQQFKDTINQLLQAAANGNRTATGTAAEAVLEQMLENAGYKILKGPVNNKGAHKADVVAFDPETKELLFFDNKVNASKKTVSRADAFVDVHDDAETAARKSAVIADAEMQFNKIADQLDPDLGKEIQSAFRKLADDPSKANFLIANATPDGVKNVVSAISERLVKRGVKMVDVGGGGKKVRAAVDAVLDAGTDATKKALGAAGTAGKTLVKNLPTIGLVVGAGLALPRLAEAAEEDRAYAEGIREFGGEPMFPGLSVLRETAVIAGEEGGGELGGWGGALAGASISWETGPGVIAGTIGGAVVFGFFGDSAGGAIAAYTFDLAAEELYQSRMAGQR